MDVSKNDNKENGSMGYQRAQWKSGLTYQQICETCRNAVRYTDESLDFRPWYPDGYVDCPVCKNHLRHNEKYAIDAPGRQAPVLETATSDIKEKFCPQCGTPFEEHHRFCCMCGAKRR